MLHLTGSIIRATKYKISRHDVDSFFLFFSFTEIMTDLSLETGFENNKAPLQWFGRRPQRRICFACVFLPSQRNCLSLSVFLCHWSNCVFGKQTLPSWITDGSYHTCQAVMLLAKSQNTLLKFTVLWNTVLMWN